MSDLKDGEQVEMQGSGKKPYILKNTGGVYSCSCPAWRNQSAAIDHRTCKHLRKLRGDQAETDRLGKVLTSPIKKAKENAQIPPLLLAHSWDGTLDPTGWWMSEKLDGVRAFWDGKIFNSRLGNVYFAPPWFTKDLPNIALDGELWIGRKQFNRTVSIARRHDAGPEWKEIKFMVFDAPQLPVLFEERMDEIFKVVKPCEFATYHPHTSVKNIEHVRDELDRIENLGGEGLMLRKPRSLYEVGRSMTLLKVKSFHDDEAKVIGHQPGKGKYKGLTGALSVKLKSGTEFEIGTGLSDAERVNPPSIGTVVKFRYQELTEAGIPRFPSYMGERED